ncbi:MAG: Asp-tRNA(Asn)/Glu-tRNA(Gln) amidotransferase subunit GatA, partial [Promethearchaeota archaeon]
MKIYENMGYELIEKIKSRELSINEVVESCFERIDETEPLLHSFVHLTKEKSLKKAKKLDADLAKGKSIGKLYGLPLANKDLICIKDVPTTCCSEILKGYYPPYNATVIERLIEEAEAIHIG